MIHENTFLLSNYTGLRLKTFFQRSKVFQLICMFWGALNPKIPSIFFSQVRFLRYGVVFICALWNSRCKFIVKWSSSYIDSCALLCLFWHSSLCSQLLFPVTKWDRQINIGSSPKVKPQLHLYFTSWARWATFSASNTSRSQWPDTRPKPLKGISTASGFSSSWEQFAGTWNNILLVSRAWKRI